MGAGPGVAGQDVVPDRVDGPPLAGRDDGAGGRGGDAAVRRGRGPGGGRLRSRAAAAGVAAVEASGGVRALGVSGAAVAVAQVCPVPVPVAGVDGHRRPEPDPGRRAVRPTLKTVQSTRSVDRVRVADAARADGRGLGQGVGSAVPDVRRATHPAVRRAALVCTKLDPAALAIYHLLHRPGRPMAGLVVRAIHVLNQ